MGQWKSTIVGSSQTIPQGGSEQSRDGGRGGLPHNAARAPSSLDLGLRSFGLIFGLLHPRKECCGDANEDVITIEWKLPLHSEEMKVCIR
jgi:hypothetical protein